MRNPLGSYRVMANATIGETSGNNRLITCRPFAALPTFSSTSSEWFCGDWRRPWKIKETLILICEITDTKEWHSSCLHLSLGESLVAGFCCQPLCNSKNNGSCLIKNLHTKCHYVDRFKAAYGIESPVSSGLVVNCEAMLFFMFVNILASSIFDLSLLKTVAFD